ncbi:MAG: chemotaxis protein CheB [Acetatifactor sp.]|nr:chemotaxis protein CheB [Acetatifactor sp.]
MESSLPVFESREQQKVFDTTRKVVEIARKHGTRITGRKIVAIASSTGGPKSLQSVIPRLPAQLQAPVLLVQHMPKGFTASLAERLDCLGEMRVKEAAEGDELENGTVYISMGGSHMNVRTTAAGKAVIHYSDEPSREGVKPCANYMYESLMDSGYDEVVCVVLTGMGADGTEGIKNLKSKKKVQVIAQDQETSVVYGMPRSVAKAGLADQIVPLEQVAQEIILNVGVK